MWCRPHVNELAETDPLSNPDGAGVDQAAAYLFRVDHPAKELVEAGRTYTAPQGGVEMLTPAGLEVLILVDPRNAKNVLDELKEQIRETKQD